MDDIRYQDRIERAPAALLRCEIERRALERRLSFWRMVAVVAVLTHAALAVLAIVQTYSAR